MTEKRMMRWLLNIVAILISIPAAIWLAALTSWKVVFAVGLLMWANNIINSGVHYDD